VATDIGVDVSLRRRLRAAAVLAVLWGAAWTVGGAALGMYRIRHGGMEFDWVRSNADVLRYVILFSAAWGGIGAANGLAFSGVLATLGRRSAPPRITAARVAQWGATGGLVLPTLFLVFLALDEAADLHADTVVAFLGGAATLGALCALGTFSLAGGIAQVRRTGEAGTPAT
jgi:hypothetical protein